MAGPRATWKGTLKISLVSIPIAVYPATEASESLSFHQLHSGCQHRITQRRWCVACGREVTTKEIVKGYEFEPGKYVILLPEELDAVQPESTRVIDLVTFADASELEPCAIDRSYYLAPDGARAIEAFVVMLIAMRHRVGLGKLAIYGREYLVAVRPTKLPGPVLMLHTLHHAAELRPVDAIDALQIPLNVPTEKVRLAQQVIAALVEPLDLSGFTDQYQADLRRLIAAKIAGQEIVEPVPVDTPPVVALAEALKQSLAAVTTTKPPAAGPRKKRTAA